MRKKRCKMSSGTDLNRIPRKLFSKLFTEHPIPEATGVVTRARAKYPQVLETPGGRRMAGGAALATGAAALLAAVREFRREGELDKIYAGHLKPGKGDIVVRVPRRRSEEDENRKTAGEEGYKDAESGFNTALSLIATALLAGGTYKGLTHLDNKRVERNLKKKEEEARKKFQRALEAKHANAEFMELVQEALPGVKSAGLGKNVAATLWLLALGLGGGSAYMTKRLADEHYGTNVQRGLDIPPERRVVFKTYDPDDEGDKTASEGGEDAEVYFKVALAVQKDLMREKPVFMDLPEFAELRQKIAQAGDNVVEAAGGENMEAVLRYMQSIRENNPQAFQDILDNDETIAALAPLLGNSAAGWGLNAAGGQWVPQWARGAVYDKARSHITNQLDQVNNDGYEYRAPGIGQIIMQLLGRFFSGARNRFAGLYNRFANPSQQQPQPTTAAHPIMQQQVEQANQQQAVRTPVTPQSRLPNPQHGPRVGKEPGTVQTQPEPAAQAQPEPVASTGLGVDPDNPWNTAAEGAYSET